MFPRGKAATAQASAIRPTVQPPIHIHPPVSPSANHYYYYCCCYYDYYYYYYYGGYRHHYYYYCHRPSILWLDTA
jgi:hypothetical protein